MMSTDYWDGKRVVVTGGYGFLGSWVTQALFDRGAIVYPMSRRTGVDLRHRYTAHYWIQEAHPHTVINCAAMQGGIGFQKTAPADIYESNMLINTNTLWAAHRAGAQKYVNIVAGCAYPGNMTCLLSEDRLFDGALHPTVTWYATPKRASIVQAQAYREQVGFDAISLVLINLYGPREHFEPNRSHALAALLRKFYEAKLNNRSVHIWGTGKPIREWTYVEDAAEGIVRAAEIYSSPDPLNIATGIGFTITDLAHIIQDIVGYEGSVIYDTDKPDGAEKKVADTRKMRFALGGWKPSTRLDEGIRKTLSWLEQNYEEISGVLQRPSDESGNPESDTDA